LSHRARKAQRPSQPASVLDSIQNRSKDLYVQTPAQKKDLSYSDVRRLRPGGLPPKQSRSAARHKETQPILGHLSFYTILSRHLRTVTAAPGSEAGLELSHEEASLLESRGYSADSVEQWTYSLLERRSVSAAWAFTDKHERPPLFLVLLYLRRQRMKSLALGIIMRHIKARLETERISWTTLQLLVIRLLRHARVVWPETIPWIATLYADQAMRMYTDAKDNGQLSPTIVSDLTRFSNSLLSLISLPASLRPVLSSLHQEKAQFEILQFMANCEPAIIMTRVGFRATARNQLAHSKTSQERTWAELKGPSWPPWKENRTAMDEEKGYEFGASRASRILHRMYEAGYEGNAWEKVAEIYAGWDTDLSPAIQTRTSLPHVSTESRNRAKLKSLLWAGRIRTTRTRREAWACFLAYEASNKAASAEVYFAMFEKIHYPQLAEEEIDSGYSRHSAGEQAKLLLAGDTKEVLPDPKSPLHHVYLSEPVPTFEELYHRMVAKNVQPANRLLAFLVENLDDFSTVMSLLEANQAKFDGGVKSLLDGSILSNPDKSSIPPYFLGSFISFLCRFGRAPHGQIAKILPIPLNPEDHQFHLKLDQSYLLNYAFSLLMYYKPPYSPAWTAYMQKVPEQQHDKASSIVVQYDTICALFEQMDEIDLDPDDKQFLILCTATRYTAWTAYLGRLAVEDARHVLSTGPRFIRTVFHNLVGADVDPNDSHQKQKEYALPPHIPEPAALHAYVRALGMLRDYEGLYSFSTWATTHHVQITARANAQHSGAQALFRTLVALRAALEGALVRGQEGASQELIELVRVQMEGVEEWGWPSGEHVNAYVAAGQKW
ncbi:hypothetical protein CC80DRAFT_412972, partial [Byssothecium circinans]